MLPSKDTRIISEIKDFFTTSEKAVETIIQIASSLTIRKNLFQTQDKNNTCYSNTTKLLLLLFFPFFEVKDSWHYSSSVLYKFVGCGKDVFYRMLNDCYLAWRNIHYRLTLQLIKKTAERSDSGQPGCRCLIVDDTDLPKTGRRIELIGRVFSHVTHKSILAFKGLFVGYHDGKSFFRESGSSSGVGICPEQDKFFCKTSHKGKWHGLMTTNTRLSFELTHNSLLVDFLYKSIYIIAVYVRNAFIRFSNTLDNCPFKEIHFLELKFTSGKAC